MNNSAQFANLKLFEKLKKGGTIRVIAFGSSNTERFMVGAHWFDYIEIGFKRLFGGGCGQFINCGISGQTSCDLLNRFDRDIAPMKPDLVIITIGGNDANPTNNVSPEELRKNLFELRSRIAKWGGQTIFQTYYAACPPEKYFTAKWAKNYTVYMQVIRDAAGEMLNDNWVRWERLRLVNPGAHRLLMRDMLHVNPIGNAVIGLDLLRKFGISLPDENAPWICAGIFAQTTLDLLEKQDNK
ncbi:MAG: SGNH/GDSL hydrolase family protein [Lentisphaeria bacterium]